MMERILNKKAFVLAVVFSFSLFYFFTISSPRDFPIDTIIEVKRGIGLAELAQDLEEQEIIRSALWFRIAAITFSSEHGVKAGEYYLDSSDNALTLAWRMVHAKHNFVTEKITIPEGYTVKQISRLLGERLPTFDSELFEKIAKEGYMFPDTYFIQVNATAEDVHEFLENNFKRKLSTLEEEIEESGFSLEEIIILASIIESEAKYKEDRQLISGILRKRLSLGMGLQVDASLGYVTGRTSAELTQSDLESNSPYNTYKFASLPPTPISNPGLESIESALRPTISPYLYFLTGDDGQMHYARTFDEHVENKRNYIN